MSLKYQPQQAREKPAGRTVAVRKELRADGALHQVQLPPQKPLAPGYEPSYTPESLSPNLELPSVWGSGIRNRLKYLSWDLGIPVLESVSYV